MRAVVALLLVAGCGRVGFGEHADASASIDSNLTPIPPSLLPGCEVYLAMDEPTWSQGVIDGCGHHPATAIDGASPVSDPERGTVGKFVGGTSCVYIPDAPELRGGSAVTVSAWVRPEQVTPDGYGIVSKRTNYMADAAYTVFVWASASGAGPVNHLYVDVDTENDRYEDPIDTLLNTWHQVTMTYDGSRIPNERIAVYFDGAFRAFATETASSIPVPEVPPPVAIGCLPINGPAQSLVGKLDDVIIWSRALPASEVTEWYDATVSAP
ncbi:MAG: LamG domain-containing protein [Kofleriaceae bacterium]|nr:LamG domain-containing protein [Kofleriaceae bacterium]